ncbi:MAG TPA: S-layer homology domain-containing protein [Anaerolineales bacterium]|nr:S-layer homology domain-containing protein [Anaerolineales bacterium]
MFIKFHEILVVHFGLILTLVAGTVTDSNRSALVDPGVPTQALALVPGGSLRDWVTNTDCPSTDQPGPSRPQGRQCAVGAEEHPGAIPITDVQTITIPALSDWQAGSLAFSHGAAGEWDHYLWGGFANSLIKRGNTYYLYYQGSPSYDNQCGSVAYRAIGVATSTDGVHWVKSDKNPVISWSSQGSIEEGAVSSAAWVGADGRIYIYYGANTGSGCLVNANARLAVSEDGENFQDLGEVLSGRDPNVWGSGDEIFPVGVYIYENQSYMYYIPNGVPLSRKLGVAIGGSPSSFTQTTGINNSTVPAWGPVSIILEGSDSVLITNPGDASRPINIYRFDAGNPSLIQFYDSYVLPDCAQASVIYESGAQHWMMSCRNQGFESYLIRHAYPVHIFADVPASHWAWQYVERLYESGITGGCGVNPFNYCPEAAVTRAQMAVFLLRGMHGSSYNPPAVGGSTGFGDVPPSYWAGAWIKQLAAEGITGGCGNGNYCPEAPVTRAQMAIFLLRSKYGAGYTPPEVVGSTGFGDVQPDYWAAAWIKQLVTEGITAGCGAGTYCPESPVTRAQMAVFLVRTFSLP